MRGPGPPGPRITTVRAVPRRRSALSALLLVALTLAACGEKEEPAPGPVSKDGTASTISGVPAVQPLVRYVEAADELCTGAMAEQEAIRRELGGRQVTLADRARLLVDLAPVRESLADELAELPPPEQRRAAARRLLAAAERRAAASTEAGRLYELDAAKDAIAEAAAAEHDERELFVEIATGIGMTDCAEILSAADEREVAAAIEQGLGSGNATERCAAFGERFLEELYGGERACVAAGGSGYATGSVEVGDAEGIDGVFALAVVKVGDRESQAFRVRLTYEDGDYKIDKLD